MKTGTRLKRGVTGSDRNHSKDQTVFHRQRSSREERRTDTDKEPDWQRREGYDQMTPNDPISENNYRGAMAAHFPASLESEEREDPAPSQTRVSGKNVPRGRTTCVGVRLVWGSR